MERIVWKETSGMKAKDLNATFHGVEIRLLIIQNSSH
jgi:hypothetical protein